MSARDHEMVVLLGPDYAGKSSVLRGLRGRSAWSLISYDDEFLQPAYAVLRDLRSLFLGEALLQAPAMHSPDFILTGLQMAIIYLRDSALAARRGGPVLVDSYYYKILAKSEVAGLGSGEVFDTWRRYPQPDRVVFMRTSPEVAFRRAQAAGAPNRFEHHSQEASLASFAAFQRALESRMLEEVRHLPVEMVDADRPISEVAASVGARVFGRCHAGPR